MGERLAFSGVYRRCPTCGAPITIPAPEGWTYDLIKEGPMTGPVLSFVTPHLGGCTFAATTGPIFDGDGRIVGRVVNVPSEYMQDQHLDFAPAPGDLDTYTFAPGGRLYFRSLTSEEWRRLA